MGHPCSTKLLSTCGGTIAAQLGRSRQSLSFIIALLFALQVSALEASDSGAPQSHSPPPVILTQGNAIPAGGDDPCADLSAPPSPAYPMPAYTVPQMAALFEPPTDVPALLTNLKVVFDRHLLAQPSFFDDEVLLKVFGGTHVQWVPPGTPHMGDWVIKPTRIARIQLRGLFSSMKTEVGLNHKCLAPKTPDVNGNPPRAPHTYDSGYIRLTFEPIEGFTVGAVRGVFEANLMEYLSPPCQVPPRLSYWPPDEKLGGPFFLNVVAFEVGHIAYEEMCPPMLRAVLPDTGPITTVSMRVIADDGTHFVPKMY